MLERLRPLLALVPTRPRETQRPPRQPALSLIISFALLGVVGIAYIAPLAAELRHGHFRIGVLVAVDASTTPFMASFIQELRRLGYEEGSNTVIDVRSADGNFGRLPELAMELVALSPDVIFAVATPPVRALKSSETSIPIVFAGVGGDPVRSGLIKSIARPGTNFTGMLNIATDIAGKRLQLLKELVPNIARAGVLLNAGNEASIATGEEIVSSSRAVGIEVLRVEFRHAEDLPQTIEKAEQLGAQALILTGDAILVANRKTIIDLTHSKRMPTAFNYPFEAAEGGLFSYGADLEHNYRGAATYVDKILRGAKAGDLPVQQPTILRLVINLKTAAALGIEIPRVLLAQADEIIE